MSDKTDTKVAYFGGVDPAPSESQRAADGTIVIMRAELRPEHLKRVAERRQRARDNAADEDDMELLMSIPDEPGDYYRTFVYGRRYTWKNKLSCRQWSGEIHRLDRAFGGIFWMLDAGAGGSGYMIKRELINKKQPQITGGPDIDVTPIATHEDAAKLVRGKFTLMMYERPQKSDKGGIKALWPDGVRGMDGMNDAMLSILKEDLDTGLLEIPPPVGEFLADPARRALYEKWVLERQWALKNLDALVDQMSALAMELDDNDEPVVTANGARQFFSNLKTDLLMGAAMANLRFHVWVKMGGSGIIGFDDDEEGAGVAGGGDSGFLGVYL